MPNPKTALRVAMAAVAVPGVIVGVAAPTASAAELSPAMNAAQSHLSEAQHTSISDASHQAVAPVGTEKVSKETVTKAAPGDLTSHHVIESSSLNGQHMSL